MSGWLGYLMTAAFLAGIAGGVHCAAMCGPILIATATMRSGSPGAWQRVLAYHAGRIASYSLAGAAAGALGSGVIAFRSAASAAAILSAVSGVAMIVLALHLAGFSPVVRRLESAGSLVWRHVQPHASRMLPAETFGRTFAVGAAWGWIPCGMVYGALVIAVSTGSPAEGALVMAAFGLGTLPNLIAISLAAQRVKRALRVRLVRLASAAIVAAFGAAGLIFAVHAHAHDAGDTICRWLPTAAQRVPSS